MPITVGDVKEPRGPTPVYWRGSPVRRCEMGSEPLDKMFYDARIPSLGMWGKICHTCFTHWSCELGTGKGQRYECQPDHRWLKTGG